MDGSVIAAIVGAVFGSTVLNTIAQSWFVRKKTDADAAALMVSSLLSWQTTLTSRIEALEKKLAEKDDIIAELTFKVAQLEADIPHPIKPTDVDSNAL